MTENLSRRELLKLSGAFAAGSVLVAACGATAEPTKAPAPTEAVAAATEAPTSAPPPPAGGNVVVMHDSKELTEEQIAQFEADNPGVTIEFVDIDLTRFFAMYAAGNPPDLIRVQAPSIPPFLARRMLQDLTPYFEGSSVLKLDDLAPSNNYYRATSPTEVGSGPIYGMCKDWSPDFTLYLYKQAFEDAGVPLPSDTEPLTYAEVFDLAAQLAAFEGDRTTMFGLDWESGWSDRIWMNILAETGKSLYNDDYTEIQLAGNEAAREVIQPFFDIYMNKLGESPLNPSPDWIGADFTRGIVAILEYGYWFSAMAESDVTAGQVLFVPAPTWTGTRRDPTMTATGMIMAAATKVPDLAWQVFEWYNGGQPSLDRAGSGWGVPALKSQYEMMPKETEFQQNVQRVLQGELDLNTPPLQFCPYIGEEVISNAWRTYAQQAMEGSMSFDEMLESMEFDTNQAIQDGIAAIG
jgi:multiple sugar transport system substrate-binding protein